MRGLDPDLICDFLGHLVLDTGGRWPVKPYQRLVIEELCAGERVVWLEIPEGNAKTTLTAGIALAHGFFVEDAAMPLAAASRDQAMTLFGQAAGLVRRSGLEQVGRHGTGHFRVLEGYRRIECARTGARLQVFAADKETADGVIPTFPIVEEAHRHRDLELMRTWRGKLVKRDGQMLVISTAGAPGSEYEIVKAEVIAQAESERHGRAFTVHRAPGMVLHRYALTPADDIEDLELVGEANPLLTVEQLQAKREDPTWIRGHWARFTCGIATREMEGAVAPEEWSALGRTEIPEGEPVWLGLDLGWKWDTTAAVPFWMPDPQRRVLGEPRVIVPPRDGSSTSSTVIKRELREVHERNPVHTVVLDPNAGGEQLAEWIEDPDDGLGARVVAYSQSNEPQALAFERWMESIREGWLEHPHDPVLNTHVLNAVAKPVLNDRRRFDRPRGTRQARGQDQRVIDALTAASNVLAVAVGELDIEPVDRSLYRMEFIGS